MRRKALFTLLLTLCSLIASAAPIGTWTSYLAYGNITEIVPTGNTVYVLSSGGLFSYRVSDNSVQTYDNTNVLSDCNIAHIAYCKAAHRLIITYQNQNIDLLDDNGDVVNVSALYNKTTTDDKTINEVRVVGTYAYISTNFGILKLHVGKGEFSDTYNLGRKVMSTLVHGDNIYAGCGKEGILKARLSDNLLDKGNWTQESDVVANNLFFFDNHLLAVADGSLCMKDGDEWQKIGSPGYSFHSQADDRLILGRADQILIYTSVSQYTAIAHPHKATAFVYDKTNDCYWSNQADNKLYSLTLDGQTIEPKTVDIRPDGPDYNYFGFLKFAHNTLYSCGGGLDGFNELYRKAVAQTFSNDEWTIFEDNIGDRVSSVLQDWVCLDIDPKDLSHVMVGGRAGLYEFKNTKFTKYYTPKNSLLEYATDNESPNHVLTLGVIFDKSGNLWCLNSQAKSASILEMKTDGTWVSHHQQALMDDNGRSLGAMKNMMFDSHNHLWFVNNHYASPSFYCYDTTTDALNHYTTFINQDGTQVANIVGIRCIAEDKEGNIWIGTNVGPLMLAADELNSGSEAVLTQVKVPRNDGTNFADYLLTGVDITCMAVDGGNRKWFGTNGNGVYLISADNYVQVHHFLTTNSQLLSNNIESVTINDQTGEVFFGTDMGLCSYMSDASATTDEMTTDNVYAYPNPVRPDYTGLITVTGLSMDADVKIVTASGALVAQGRSNGGSFTWDGCDSSGHRVASGVYMVMTATKEGKSGTVCKIAIVN